MLLLYIIITTINHTMSLKPYRSIRLFDETDKKYTDTLKKSFNDLPRGIKSEFQLFTDHLMDDESISSYQLLDAIRDFYKKNKEICDGALYNSWKIFDNIAFNYRPWQG